MDNESYSNGLKMDFKSVKEIYNSGELPEFDVEITNISDKNIVLCTYMIKHRLLSGLYAGNFNVYPFGTTPSPLLYNDDFLNMKPDETYSVHISLEEKKGYGLLYSASIPAIVKEGMALRTLPSGEYTFCVHLGHNIVFSLSEPGTYTHSLIVKNVLKDIERARGVSVDEAVMWDGSLSAWAKVSFS